MKKSASLILALTLALIGTTEAFAICAQAKPASWAIGTPPHPYAVKNADPIGIISKCHGDSARDGGVVTIYGCVRQTSPSGFTIWVNSTLKGPTRDCVIEHEKAHLFGWQHSGRLKGHWQQIDPYYKGPNPIK